MKTKAKRFAAILMAAVMTAALAVPVFADDATEPADPKTGDSITTMEFDKILDAADDTYHPNETFNFTIAAASADQGETTGESDAPVSDGVEGGAKFASANDSKVSMDTSKKGTQTYGGLKITFDASKFSDPGIYKYTVTETVPAESNKDIKYASPKTLYVYVKYVNGNKVVYAASLGDADGEVKEGNFTNTYRYNGGEPDKEFKDLVIQKTVTGAMGEKNREFKFKVKITSSSGRAYYAAYKSTSTTEIKLNSGSEYSDLTLKDGETFTIKNLAAGDIYLIEETDANQDGYSTKYKVGSADPVGELSDCEMGDEAVTVTVTNNRDAVTPTGIFMNYAPYICMIAAAAVLAFVFLRRKEDI